jgi:hypothetical protein
MPMQTSIGMVARSRQLVVVLLVALTGAVMLACHRPSPVKRVIPGVRGSVFAELTESDLAALVVCHDTLGRPLGGRRTVEVSRCTPCIPYGMQTSADRSVGHARRLWQQAARAPYDTLDVGVGCARLAYQYARVLRANDDSLAVEIAIVHLADARDSLRARTLTALDSVLQRRIASGLSDPAAHMLSQLADGIWDRAQRQLERPADIDVDALERAAHHLDRSAPVMRHLPAVPATSTALGVSEAEWAARLYDAAARLASSPEERSRWMRLSLAPWVVLEDWVALDSAASALLRRAPNDSALLPARALAAYRTMQRPVLESPSVMTLFDSVVAHLPRADSMRYDSFDGVLTADDDAWRYGFLPDQRIDLESRGWAVLDPLWSTPVNEIRLARRARVAEADYRHADIARPGEAGSETQPGQILVRRGPPTAQWTVSRTRDGAHLMERSWPGLVASSMIEARDAWRVFYGTHFSLLTAGRYPPSEHCTDRVQAFPTLHACATARRSEWSSVPFFGTTDAIDVTIARFRAIGDSADMYVGARVPLRAFKHRDDLKAVRTDRITLGMWLATELGATIRHESVSHELPAANLPALTHQWTPRVGSRRMMHRVEAMEPTKPSGARGIARFTSDAQTAFPVRGFGMSDILIAARATPRTAVARRWNDLAIQPNGGTIVPKARFAMVWEVYDLTPGPDGRVRWRVRVKRERGAMVVRDDMKDVLVGSAKAGSRVVADESAAPDFAYVREEAPSEALLENIVFGLDDAPPGHHVVNVTIDDLVSGKSVTRGVSVRVLIPDSQRRGTPLGSPFDTPSTRRSAR